MNTNLNFKIFISNLLCCTKLKAKLFIINIYHLLVKLLVSEFNIGELIIRSFYDIKMLIFLIYHSEPFLMLSLHLPKI